MTLRSPIRLLVSVRSAAEASAALDGGADVIDIKEPTRGPMGMADLRVIHEVVEAVAGRADVSVALGELKDAPPMAALPAGVTYAKVGLAAAPPDWRERLPALFAQAEHVQPIVVAYVNPSRDAEPPAMHAVVTWALEGGGVRGVLFDTYLKDRGSLFESRLSPRSGVATPPQYMQVQAHVERIKRAGLLLGLAGSLTASTVELAASLGPDLIGVRGAACAEQSRTGVIDSQRVRLLAGVIAECNVVGGRVGD